MVSVKFPIRCFQVRIKSRIDSHQSAERDKVKDAELARRAEIIRIAETRIKDLHAELHAMRKKSQDELRIEYRNSSECK